jgi:hypothetical protein
VDKKELAFLRELSKLTVKYGIAIGGCGCCGSTYLYGINGNGINYVNLFFNEETSHYEMNEDD